MEELGFCLGVQGVVRIKCHGLLAFQLTIQGNIHTGEGLIYLRMGQTLNFSHQRQQGFPGNLHDLRRIIALFHLKKNNML